MKQDGAPYRAAIVGTGGIARAHAAALRTFADRIELVAVADIDPERSRAFAEEFSVPRTHADAAALLDAEELDLVHVCTPPQSHVPLAIAAMRAGVPPLVEKPTSLSLAGMRELERVAEETGVPTLTVFQHRYGRAARRLIDLVSDGALGRPLVATCETLWYRDDDYFAVPWRGTWEAEGGGPTMGHGIHQFDLLLAVLGPWAHVTAFAGRQSRPTETEDVSMALARFDNGALATVVSSVVSPRQTSRLRFDFERATVEVEHLYGYRDTDWTFTPAPGSEHLADAWALGDNETVSGHAAQIGAVLDAFDAGEEPGVGLADATRTLEFAAATYASAFRGEVVHAGQISGDDPFETTMSGGMVPWPQKQNARETA